MRVILNLVGESRLDSSTWEGDLPDVFAKSLRAGIEEERDREKKWGEFPSKLGWHWRDSNEKDAPSEGRKDGTRYSEKGIRPTVG